MAHEVIYVLLRLSVSPGEKEVEFTRAGVLKPRRASESPGGFKTEISGPHSKSFWYSICGVGSKDLRF